MPHSFVAAIIGWIERMVERHGSVVVGYGRQWDWGQALAVEQYGVDFSTWPDAPTAEDVKRAFAWENGDWPDWASAPKEEVE